MENIQNFLFDAERRRIDELAIKSWLSKLKDVMYDADDIIDLCKIKGLQLLARDKLSSPSSSYSSVQSRFPSLLSCCCITVSGISSRHQIGKNIKKLTSRIEEISKNRLELNLELSSPVVHVTQVNRRQTSSLLPSNVVGGEMEDATNKLVGLLNEVNESLRVFAIVGIGGIGKTTLAQKIYNHRDVQANFKTRLWVCVSQNYSETELLKQLIREAGGNDGIGQSKEELLRLLNTTITGKRFLLVLDDVWRADVWVKLLQSPLQNGGQGSKVLVTTRNNNVSKSMLAFQTYQMNKLSEDDGWRLLSNIVFENEADTYIQDLQDIGIKIVQKCDGLPLAIEAIAGVLRTKGGSKREWERVYSSQAWSTTGDLPEEVRGALYLSYEELSSQLKQCFLSFSLFPEDHVFKRDDLIWWWVSEGFVTEQEGSLLEDTAEDYYYELTSRNILHLDPEYVDYSQSTMHDVVRSLAIFLAQDESCFIEPNHSLSSGKTFSIKRRLGIGSKLESINSPNERLRTLHIFNQQNVNLEDLCDKFRHLRVLNLRDSLLDNIPSSIKNLQHLRHLDLRKTAIRELPESIGCLPLLLILNLTKCKFLHVLPESITQLYNLRRLGIRGTSLCHIPAGIGKLEHLNDIGGFVVCDGQENGEQKQQHRQHGCSLNELQSLYQIRRISIYKLERASTTSGSIRPLKDKTHLKELILSCTDSLAVEDSMGFETIYEDLCPSPSLEILNLYSFYGVKFPGWMSMLLNLTDLGLYNCFDNCTQLPTLGHLPQLQRLWIEGAATVTSIGVECLVGCKQGTAFPKLEVLVLKNLPNLKEWTWDIVEAAAASSGGANNNTISRLLPRLKNLEISHCPQLRALPDGFRHASALEKLVIENARSLMEVDSLSFLETLIISNCTSLECISNLPAIKVLQIVDSCRMLILIENLNTVQQLIVIDCSMKSLPECLLGLIRNSVTDNGTLRMFGLKCNQYLGEKCREDGEYWSLIQNIQQLLVEVGQDEDEYQTEDEGEDLI